MTLYSYIVREDHGFAPNPYGGVLTVTCCKPVIRRVAKANDYVAGISGADHPAGRGLLLYAAKITGKMTMTDYRRWAESECTDKIPGPGPSRVGDAMYWEDPAGVWHRDRRGYHHPDLQEDDVGGRYALLSTDFAYFGVNPIELPEHLRPIADVRRGHRSSPSNDEFLDPFAVWFDRLSDRGRCGTPTLGPMIPQRVDIKRRS